MREPALERQGRRLERAAVRFLALASLAAVPGATLVVIGHDSGPHTLSVIGVVALLVSCAAAVLWLALLLSSVVVRWSARKRMAPPAFGAFAGYESLARPLRAPRQLQRLTTTASSRRSGHSH